MTGTVAPGRVKRPPSVIGGVLLMGVRALTGGFAILTVVLSWDSFVGTIVVNGEKLARSDPPAAGAVLGWLLAAYGLYLVLYLGLAVLVFTGHNWARVVAMSFASVSILLSFADYALNGAQITLRTSLVSVTIDILILLALSSTQARHYARAARASRA
ncbi:MULTISPECIES: hypothetical protein [Cryobacterium]|uniref:hypothetical protein n=1 Tax=Cryobacterium TaxID=69578 RepID=UPI000CD4358E|nr:MULTISPECIES: hypothetical protein [Cryobacterium]POH67201.1 hypothetical protein C3B60_08895 [Cryobacterium zongtaii]TFC43892.1 hypothetical protein E3O57_11670 [Cryobacterium sp. TMN-39-2]